MTDFVVQNTSVNPHLISSHRATDTHISLEEVDCRLFPMSLKKGAYCFAPVGQSLDQAVKPMVFEKCLLNIANSLDGDCPFDG